MEYSSVKIWFFVSAVLFLFALDQVSSQTCNPTCRGGPHDKCSSCASHCPRTCAQPNGPDACITVCKVNACECEPGYVRAPNGYCVRPWQCPSNETIFINPIRKCNTPCFGGPFDRCEPCGTMCPATCARPNPQACTKDCAINVCRCIPGYVRAPNGLCVRQRECPNVIIDPIWPVVGPISPPPPPPVYPPSKC